MRHPSSVDGSSETPDPSIGRSWISMGAAALAIAAAAVLCVESFLEADKSMERLHATSTLDNQTSPGYR